MKDGQVLLGPPDFSEPTLREIRIGASPPIVDGEYLHWDDLLHREPPNGIRHEDWWNVLKHRRRAMYSKVPLEDKQGLPFVFCVFDSILKSLHELDRQAAGRIEAPDPIANPNVQDRYYVSSLIDEAITSSQLEGAATTRRVAREMIRQGRPPRDRSERMILNNYEAMREISRFKDKPLTPQIVLKLHRILTAETLKNPDAAGRLRTAEESDERFGVWDDRDRLLHAPPPAEELPARLKAMCDFANDALASRFVHPVLRSIVLHFWLAYDHPFVDGNGRCARALFYWSMLHRGYWLFEFVSISRLIRKAPARYGEAFLHTETDDNDLTYFIIHQLKTIRRAIDDLHHYLERQSRKVRTLESQLRGFLELNHRQKALVAHALRHPGQHYTIRSHRMSHQVVYQTARRDLLQLHERGLLELRKIGKAFVFTPAPNLEARLAKEPSKA
jgi:Fic family protein